jgi:hypothetical protein
MLRDVRPYLFIGKFYNEYFHLPQISDHMPRIQCLRTVGTNHAYFIGIGQSYC